jgi:hypothetical protein
MDGKLEQFIGRIDGFDDLSKKEQIEWFGYYLINIAKDEITIETVKNCYHSLHIPPYSNISQLLKNSKVFYIKSKETSYSLAREKIKECEAILNIPRLLIASNDLFPKELLLKSRKYIEIVGNQAIVSYDNGQFDACMVMSRKLVEILIIESFERYKIEHKIKGSNGNFFFLSGLISAMQAENVWNISRNALKSLSEIKKGGDLSAHNRRYTAKKPDIEKIKGDLRIVIEELVHLIDYPNWKKEV